MSDLSENELAQLFAPHPAGTEGSVFVTQVMDTVRRERRGRWPLGLAAALIVPCILIGGSALIRTVVTVADTMRSLTQTLFQVG